MAGLEENGNEIASKILIKEGVKLAKAVENFYKKLDFRSCSIALIGSVIGKSKIVRKAFEDYLRKNIVIEEIVDEEISTTIGVHYINKLKKKGNYKYMNKWGISVYPNHTDINVIVDYIHLAGKYGFKRIFTCLISITDKSIDYVMEEFKIMLNAAKEEEMEVIADIDPVIFEKFNASITDLKVFKDMGLYGIRLDLGFGGREESIMTYNEYDLKIELNMCNDNMYIDNVLSNKPNINNLYGCHNFYPHKYTGNSIEHFMKCSKQFKKYGLNTAAFINSPSAKYGPWPVSEGLCTLEMHRELPIDVQAKHFLATGLIDDIIIANSFATEDEFKTLSKLNKENLIFNINLDNSATELNRKIVLEELHVNRGDISEYMLRSSESRVKYKGESFPVVNTPDIKRGDILIDSDLYTKYAGELQVALKDMNNSGRTNVVGKIVDDELFLLDYIGPWTSFGFKVIDRE